jgi:hypothetical protein
VNHDLTPEVQARLNELPEPARAIIVDLHAAAPEFAETEAARIQVAVASFAEVPGAEIAASMLGICNRCLAALTRGRGPRASEFVEAHVIRRRAEQGISLEDVLLAFRYAFRLIRDWIMSRARDNGMGAEDATHWLEILWDVENAGQTQFGALSRQMAHEDGQRAERERAHFIRDLLFPPVRRQRPTRPSSAVLSRFAPNKQYRVVRARSYDRVAPQRLMLEMETVTRSEGMRPLLIVHDGDVLGVISQYPKESPSMAAVAVSDVVDPSDAADIVPLVTRILDVVTVNALEGVYDLGRIGMLLAVSEQPELGRMYIERYVDPIREMGTFGEALLESLEIYIALDCDLQATADRLFVHSNTIRHRLRRVESSLSVDLNSNYIIREIWWALAAWKIRRDSCDRP